MAQVGIAPETAQHDPEGALQQVFKSLNAMEKSNDPISDADR